MESSLDHHEHSSTCFRLLKPVLYKDEKSVFEIKQSRMVSLSPARVVATDRRLIVLKPSFWGLHFGHDILSPTSYDIIPYQFVLGVSMTKGMILSSIKMHHSGVYKPDGGGGQAIVVNGIHTKDAATFTNFIEEIIEYDEKQPEKKQNMEEWPGIFGKEGAFKKIALDEALEYVHEKNKRFIWLGVESASDVAKALGVTRDKILPVNGPSLAQADRSTVRKFEGDVLVSYDEMLSRHVAREIRTKYGINLCILRGGMINVVKASGIGKEEFS
jgi:hypothetical protein